MKVSLFFAGLIVLATATDSPLPTQFPQKKIADKSFLEKQIAVIKLLWGVTQTETCPEILEIANSFQIEENLDHYTNVDAVKNFISIYKFGTLSKEEIFTIFNERHLKEAIALFNILFHAKDFETFYKTACWARINFNAGQFVYALSVAVAHREDFKGIILPAPYEIFPHFFVDSEIIQKAYQIKILKGTKKSDEPVIITVNNTGFYPYYQYNFDKQAVDSSHNNFYDQNLKIRPENRLAYFTEDIAINTYNYYNHLYNPFYLNSTYDYKIEGRGELFFYYHQQILARYFLERLSNDLSLEVLDLEKPIHYGYNPSLRYPNGKAFPARSDDALVSKYSTFELKIIEDFVRRISDAIDFGFIFTESGEKISLYEPAGIDYLGHLVEATAKSVHPRFYGKLFYYMIKVLGRTVDNHYNHELAPAVLEHYETALRDPVFYQLQAFLGQLYYNYKDNLNSYKYEELVFPGVKITSVEIDKLITFFENFEFDISSVISTSHLTDDITVKARQYRLSHKPFNYKINIVSEKAASSMIRIFIGPKYDVEGKLLSLNEKRKFMVEIDRFPYQIEAGKNVIDRSSSEIINTAQDQITVSELYKTAKEALEGTGEFYYEEGTRQCGFPDRFILPKGKRGGLPLTFFVVITPITDDIDAQSINEKYLSTLGCGTGLGLFPQDGNAMGFPFDRIIDKTQFSVPNFYEKDIIIFHKRGDEIANASS